MSASDNTAIAPWIQTAYGNQFWPMHPDPELIDIDEAALTLSRTGRFGNHYKEHIESVNVAWHSVCVCDLVNTEELKLPALLHDLHEAYTGFGDVCASVKQFFPGLKSIERGIDKAVAKKFGFDVELFYYDEIRHADLVMLATEKKFCMAPSPVPWIALPDPLIGLPRHLTNPHYSRDQFLVRFRYLMEQRK